MREDPRRRKGIRPCCSLASWRHGIAVVLLLLIHSYSSRRNPSWQHHPSVMASSSFERPYVPLCHYDIDYGTEDRFLQDDSSSASYEPIRITFDTRVLESVYGLGDTTVDGKIDFILQDILPAMQEKWSQHLFVRPVPVPIRVEPDVCSSEYATILTNTMVHNQSDLVVLVGGDPGQRCGTRGGTLAYAFPCALDTRTGRPTIGTFNFCLSTITTSEIIGGEDTILELLGGEDLPQYYSMYTQQTFQRDRLGIAIKDVAVHEMAHILGFSFLLYPFMRDAFGNPRTERDSTGLPVASQRPCGNGTVITDTHPSESTIQVAQDAATGAWEHYMVTERVRAVTQMQFNCSSLPGARLEDGNNCYGSHWHERDFYGELLSPVVSEGTENVLSYLTLAFLEDTGWYLVDYRGASYSSFGLLAGCGFVNEPCVNATTNQVAEGVENEFCTAPVLFDDGTGVPVISSLNSVFCDPSHHSWTLCDLSNVRTLSPNERTYFSDPTLTTVAFVRADNCPIPNLQLGLKCSDNDISYSVFYDDERIGTGSRCINAYYENGDFGRAYQPACMAVTCDATAGVVRLGSNYVCTYDGEALSVAGGNRSDGATLICPRLAALCPELYTCPDGCFGRGECVYSTDATMRPTCRCFDASNTHTSCAPTALATRGAPWALPVATPVASSPMAAPSSVVRSPASSMTSPSAAPVPVSAAVGVDRRLLLQCMIVMFGCLMWQWW